MSVFVTVQKSKQQVYVLSIVVEMDRNSHFILSSNMCPYSILPKYMIVQVPFFRESQIIYPRYIDPVKGTNHSNMFSVFELLIQIFRQILYISLCLGFSKGKISFKGFLHSPQ